MIFLNEKEFIDEAIRSVLSQTYGNRELLLLDDGSQHGFGISPLFQPAY
jgi:glycosyltransferase involved in cell wall biosynthesis